MRLLAHTVDERGMGDADGLEDGRRHINHVVPLVAELAVILLGDLGGPGDDHGVGSTAIVGGHLLYPLERCVHRVHPAGRVVVVEAVGAELVHVHKQVIEVVLQIVKEGHLVGQALQSPLSGRAVVADHQQHQGVILLAQFLDALHDAADLVIGVSHESGIDLAGWVVGGGIEK